ncbi:TPA: hypothetical protein HA273_05075, partial [Candidatus Bathyarchaeota archaeon]|nr:hypothetical protein [Candidatus Bathyarchaeota archaeon]
ASPAAGWRFGGWTGNLTGILNPSSITITGNSAVTAVFVANQYTISASASEGGSISPSGITIVDNGGNQTYNITASFGYHIVSVTVNGTSVGVVNSYMVSNVTGDTTIAANFVLNAFAINSWAGPNGSIDPNGTVAVAYGETQLFAISPDVGFHIAEVLVDGVSIGAVTPYAFENVTSNHEISVTFEYNFHTIESNAGPNGTISPAGIVVADWNATQSYTITPDENYRIEDVIVDGVSVGAVSSYVFAQIKSDHNITASFALNVNFFINIISEYGSTTSSALVNAGDSHTVSVTESEGDASHRWICTGYSVDGGQIVAGASYTFANVRSNHTIAFNWQEQYYLNVVSPEGSATGSGWYDAGTTITVSVSSNPRTIGNGVRLVFIGWNGDASGMALTSNPIQVDGPKTATTDWTTEYQVTYAAQGNVLPLSAPQTEWVTSGEAAKGTFPTTLMNPAGNTRNILVNDNRPATITEATTITGAYKTEHLVVFIQNGLESDVKGTVATILEKTYDKIPNNIWIEAGHSVTFTYKSTVESTTRGKQYLLTSTNSTSPLTINEPITIQAYYEPQTSSNLNTILLAAVILSIPPLVAIPTFALRKRKRKITPIAIGGGSVSPGTVQTIEPGDDSTVFIITANPGYRIADVVIDNYLHLGAVRTYKFQNVTENHTISAIFYED